MSHNIAHFNTLAPSREGAVDPALSDLSDVSGSPTDGQLLAYSGAGWAPTSSSPGDAVGAVARAHGGGATSASSVTIISPNPYIGATDPNRFYWEWAAASQSGTVRITKSATADISWIGNTYGAGTEWLVGVEFNTAGVYRLNANFHVGELSAAGAYLDVQWTDRAAYVALGPRCRVGRSDEKRNAVIGVINASVGDIAGLYIHTVSAARFTQQTYAEYQLFIEKL